MFYPIPFGDAVIEMNARVVSGSGLIVVNRYGQEFTLEIAGKPYKARSNGKTYILLPPGHYTWSADLPGVRRLQGTVDVVEGKYSTQGFSPNL